MFHNFYYASFRRTMVAFASLFDEIEITLDNGKNIIVPLHYAQKEKFIEVITAQPNKTSSIKNISMPIMGFEITSVNYAPERNKNQLHKLRKCDSGSDFMYNKVPYDVNFELYIATKRLDDSFKIVEQILPNFSPGITVKVKDFPEFDAESNITIELTSASMNIEYEDDFSDVRHITWQISFSIKTHLYRDVKHGKQIESVIVNAINGYNDNVNSLTKYMTFVDDEKNIITEEINDE